MKQPNNKYGLYRYMSIKELAHLSEEHGIKFDKYGNASTNLKGV